MSEQKIYPYKAYMLSASGKAFRVTVVKGSRWISDEVETNNGDRVKISDLFGTERAALEHGVIAFNRRLKKINKQLKKLEEGVK